MGKEEELVSYYKSLTTTNQKEKISLTANFNCSEKSVGFIQMFYFKSM
jgi:hypothetical protein